VLADALRRLDGEGIQVDDVGLRRPTLDDVFLTLTGHVAEEHPDETGDGSRDSGPDERRSDHRADQGSESESVR
jgi:ABC-2 type transport system ATP-binding protein